MMVIEDYVEIQKFGTLCEIVIKKSFDDDLIDLIDKVFETIIENTSYKNISISFSENVAISEAVADAIKDAATTLYYKDYSLEFRNVPHNIKKLLINTKPKRKFIFKTGIISALN